MKWNILAYMAGNEMALVVGSARWRLARCAKVNANFIKLYVHPRQTKNQSEIIATAATASNPFTHLYSVYTEEPTKALARGDNNGGDELRVSHSI